MTRLQTLAVLIAVLWGVVLLRAVGFAARSGELQRSAVRQRLVADEIDAEPGRLTDRNGRVLAVSQRRLSVAVNPSRIDDPKTFATVIGPVLQLEPEAIERTLRTHADKRFRWLRRQVDDATESRLQPLELPVGALELRREWDRIYPHGPLASHLLGFRDIDHAPRDGLERRYDAELTGRTGRQVRVSDSRGATLSLLDRVAQPPQNGQTIRLAIDAGVQAIAARELDAVVQTFEPAWAAAVVIDVPSSSLLAIETRPTFDPNRPAAAATAGRNHAAQTAVEPGSTVKPLLVAAALDAGLVDVATVIDCGTGHETIAGREVRDSHAVGRVRLAEVLVESSNIGAVRVARRLGRPNVWSTLDRFGFGQSPPVLPSIGRPGQLVPVEGWSDFSLASHAMGYETTITPLGLASAYATLARDGERRPLRLRADDIAVQTEPTHIVTAETARWLRTGPLTEVVRRGTASRAWAPGPVVWGKTGTAQKYDRELGRYVHDRATCLFVGGIPADRPRLVVALVVDAPMTGPGTAGGSVAAPAAGRLLRDTLTLLRAQGATRRSEADGGSIAERLIEAATR